MAIDILDNRDRFKQIDRGDMAGRITGMANQFREISGLVEKTQWSSIGSRDFTSIAILGMGGSAIGGDLLSAYAQEALSIPIFVVRDYTLPAHIDRNTLIIASSYSGNTEETLSACDQARKRGSEIVTITSGGELAGWGEKYHWPIILLPDGWPPRTALGYSFGALLFILAKYGLLDDPSRLLLDLADYLQEQGGAFESERPIAENIAKQLAVKLHGRIPLMYGAVGLMSVAARRWAGQFCENAKNLAFSNEAPEFNHNEVVGWGMPEKSNERLYALFLQSETDHSRVCTRFEISRTLLNNKSIPSEILRTSGNYDLQNVFSLIQLGDWVSYYLAMLNEVDPTEISAIDYLKTELNKHRSD